MSVAPFSFEPAPGVRIVEDGRAPFLGGLGGQPVAAFDTRTVRLTADRIADLAAAASAHQHHDAPSHVRHGQRGE